MSFDAGDYDPGQYNQDDHDWDAPESNNFGPKKANCPTCNDETEHRFEDGHFWCKKCASTNTKLEEELGFENVSKTPDSESSATKFTGVVGSSTMIGNPDFKLKGNFGRLQNLMNTTTTTFERQILRNHHISEEVLTIFGLAEPLDSQENSREIKLIREEFKRIYQKTLRAKLQTGRSAFANIIAALIITFRLNHIKYNVEEMISEIQEDPNSPEMHYPLRKTIWSAERRIIERFFGKIPCTIHKDCPKKIEIYLIQCPRENRIDVPPKNFREHLSPFLTHLHSSLIQKFPFSTVLENSNLIFDDAEKKGLLSGLKPETILSAITLLAINQTTTVTATEIADVIETSKNTIKKTCDNISDGLNLGVKIELFEK